MNLEFRVFNRKTKKYSSFSNLNKIIDGNVCFSNLIDDDELVHEPYTYMFDYEKNKIYFWDVLKSKDNRLFYVDYDNSVSSFCLIELNGDVDQHLYLSIGNIDFMEMVVVGRRDEDGVIYNHSVQE